MKLQIFLNFKDLRDYLVLNMKKNTVQSHISQEFYSVKDIVSMKLASQAQVYNLFNSAGFPCIKVGSALRVKKEDFWAWVELQKRKN